MSIRECDGMSFDVSSSVFLHWNTYTDWSIKYSIIVVVALTSRFLNAHIEGQYHWGEEISTSDICSNVFLSITT